MRRMVKEMLDDVEYEFKLLEFQLENQNSLLLESLYKYCK